MTDLQLYCTIFQHHNLNALKLAKNILVQCIHVHDTFTHNNLQFIQAVIFFCQGIKPVVMALLCSNSRATKYACMHMRVYIHIYIILYIIYCLFHYTLIHNDIHIHCNGSAEGSLQNVARCSCSTAFGYGLHTQTHTQLRSSLRF